ncbi:RADIL protein, partial [Polypterus senegalus]
MFYGSSASMSLPSKNKLKRQSRTFTQVLYRTLSYRDRRSVADIPNQIADDPAELSTQTSAPGVLKIFGDEICAGANYKSVLATPRSSAQELVKEALERYSLSKAAVSEYLLCDVIGKFEGTEKKWRTECLRALGDNEKPLLLQDLWKPKEGFARRFELRKRADVEEMASKEIDTITADINAQARKLQRNRAKGATSLTSGTTFCRSLSETSLNLVGSPVDEPKRYYSTLPGPLRGRYGKEGSICSRKKEERESGGVRHSLYHSPHLLLLQGYSQRNDCLVYLLNRDQHTVGQETSSARPNICLSSPDILPLHCKIKKIQVLKRLSQTVEERLVMEPLPRASILINFSKAEHTTPLRHGDLLSFGAHYIFLYKDPVSAKPLPAQTLARLKALSQLPDGEIDQIAPFACKVCGAVIKEKQQLRKSFKPNLNKSKNLQRRKLHLEFEKVHEDELIGRIISLIEPGGDDHKLTPAYLLCLCIKHSATAFEAGSFGKLLLKIVKRIQSIAWDPASLSLLSITDLVPDLQLIVFWMANSIEILYFIQQKTPEYIQGIEDVKGSKESLLSTTISANEEAMTILEEVIMYTFQQCVYYITKSLYVCLPGLLECNPFLTEATDSSWRSSASVPEAVRKVVLIYQTTLDLLQQYEVHMEVQSQMFAYLFFFTNVSLFNQLLDKGDLLESFENHPPIVLPSSGFKVDLESDCVDDNIYRQLLYVRHFLWGVKTRASPSNGNSDMQELTNEIPGFHSNLRTTVVGGHSTPVDQQRPGSHVEMDTDGRVSVMSNVSCTSKDVHPHDDRLKEKLHQFQIQTSLGRNGSFRHAMQPLDPSCLLTPPNTPLYTEFSQTESLPVNGNPRITHNSRKGVNGFIANGLEGNINDVFDFPTPVSSSHSSAADDFCYVFVVELDKGPFGLGMGLIDGLHTPLNLPGIYIRTLIPDGPAASDGRLNIGDRILAVNGTSLIGADYQSAVDLIRLGGGRLRFLVAKSDKEVSEKISASSC